MAGIEGARQTPYGQAKLAVEARLLRSSLREVIVRPAALREVVLSPAAGLDWDNGRLTIFGRGEAPVRYVAVDDVAATVARWALAGDPPRRAEFGGPEALSRNEVASLIERAAGRPMKRRRVPRPVLAAGSRILKRLKPELATVMGLSLMMDDGAAWDDRPPRELGIEPRSASAYIAEKVGSQEPQQPLEGPARSVTGSRKPRVRGLKAGLAPRNGSEPPKPASLQKLCARTPVCAPAG